MWNFTFKTVLIMFVGIVFWDITKMVFFKFFRKKEVKKEDDNSDNIGEFSDNWCVYWESVKGANMVGFDAEKQHPVMVSSEICSNILFFKKLLSVQEFQELKPVGSKEIACHFDSESMKDLRDAIAYYAMEDIDNDTGR